MCDAFNIKRKIPKEGDFGGGVSGFRREERRVSAWGEGAEKRDQATHVNCRPCKVYFPLLDEASGAPPAKRTTLSVLWACAHLSEPPCHPTHLPPPTRLYMHSVPNGLPAATATGS